MYAKVKEFIQDYLFGKKVDLNDRNVLRNLSETEARRTILETFKKYINELTVVDKGEAQIANYIKISNTRPFIVKPQDTIVPKKSVFNRIIGDSHFELEFAAFLEHCDDIVSFSKNFLAIGFKLDYKNAAGEISTYYPDFIVKVNEKEIYIVETKGNEDLDDPLKLERLKQWCDDVNANQSKVTIKNLYVTQINFEKYRPKTLTELVKNFS